jgi:hypothetical protein
MKTTLLFAAVLIFSSAAFSQEASSTTNVDANAKVKADAIAKSSTKADKAAKATAHVANTEKREIQGQAKSDLKQTKSTVKSSGQISASSQTAVSERSSVRDNKSSNETSLNQKTSSSANTDGKSMEELKKDGHSTVQASAATVDKTNQQVSAKAKSSTRSVKAKPAFAQMNTHVGAATAIKIK